MKGFFGIFGMLKDIDAIENIRCNGNRWIGNIALYRKNNIFKTVISSNTDKVGRSICNSKPLSIVNNPIY